MRYWVIDKENFRGKKSLKRVFAVILLIVCGAAIGGAYYQRIQPVIKQNALVPAAKTKGNESLKRDTLLWTSAMPAERSKLMAFGALLKEWGISSQKNSGTKEACSQILGKGLRCLEGNTSLDQLIVMNRPAVVRLADEQGKEYYAALKTIKDTIARVAIGSEDRTVDITGTQKTVPR